MLTATELFGDQLHIRNVNRPFHFDDTAFRAVLSWFGMLLDHADTFNNHTRLLREDLEHTPLITLTVPRDHDDFVVLFNVCLAMLIPSKN